jgi:osmotically-inducible protein OsmY
MTDDRPKGPNAPRSLLERTRDEVQAWLGDGEAAGRRQRDQAAGDQTGKGPANSLEPDARIIADISQRLTDDAGLDASRVEVDSREGLVTLKGDVSTSAQRSHAEELAATVAGVQYVENRLQVV